jgi:Pyruvate/2-oxoacid:ferredoxin oxidoreductase delta subunit
VSAPENCYNHKKDDNPICELCILSCPDQAITWTSEGKEEGQARGSQRATISCRATRRASRAPSSRA